MEMEYMNAGTVAQPIEVQHEQLAALRDEFPELVIPFAAADPRRSGVVEQTVQLLEERGFRGIKLYPPTDLGRTTDTQGSAHSTAITPNGRVLIESHETTGGRHSFWDISKPRKPRLLSVFRPPGWSPPRRRAAPRASRSACTTPRSSASGPTSPGTRWA
jgi:hypothetical protein